MAEACTKTVVTLTFRSSRCHGNDEDARLESLTETTGQAKNDTGVLLHSVPLYGQHRRYTSTESATVQWAKMNSVTKGLISSLLVFFPSLEAAEHILTGCLCLHVSLMVNLQRFSSIQTILHFCSISIKVMLMLVLR